MGDGAWLYERLSWPVLMLELRHLRGELEKLTARAEVAVAEVDRRLPAREGPGWEEDDTE